MLYENLGVEEEEGEEVVVVVVEYVLRMARAPVRREQLRPAAQRARVRLMARSTGAADEPVMAVNHDVEATSLLDDVAMYRRMVQLFFFLSVVTVGRKKRMGRSGRNPGKRKDRRRRDQAGDREIASFFFVCCEANNLSPSLAENNNFHHIASQVRQWSPLAAQNGS